MILLRLFWEFFKTGLFAVGGGLATLPFLSRMADTTGWFTKAQLADMVAVSESTPGPIGVNMATYVGFATKGVIGSVTATIGLIAPSIIVVLLVAAALKKVRDNRFVNSAFYCLRPASTGLIAAAGIGVAKTTLLMTTDLSAGIAQLFDWKAIILAACLILVTRVIKKTKKLHPVVWIFASAAIGIAFSFGGV